MAETLRRTIGRYELRRQLGRGMMGVVYEGVDPGLGRRVALKTIDVAFALSARERDVFEQRFLAEARLSHPGIVSVHDVGRDGATGQLYMALEYLEGKTLAEAIEEGGPLPWREALRMTCQIAEALHHAHSQGVIHRDVKPANIMLLPSGRTKIMDFGIAKSETARIKLTATGEFFGTPLYMAPEQALGRKVDSRADLFSLGAIVYRMLTGKHAFAAQNITKIIARVVRENPPLPSRVTAEVPREVDYLVARALAKDPADRYADGKTLAEDAGDILQGRVPRHRSGWHPPAWEEAASPTVPAGTGTEAMDLELVLVGAALRAAPRVDLEAELATLVSGREAKPPGERPKPSGVGPLPPPGPVAPRVPGRTGRRRRLGKPQAAALGALAVLAALAALRVAHHETWLGGLENAGPAPPAAATPVHRVPEKPLASPSAPTGPSSSSEPSPLSSVPGSPEADPAAAPRRPGAAVGRLAIDFEHSLESGRLEVWVDGRPVFEKELEGWVAKKLAGIKIRKGRVQKVLELSPGDHVVRVQVAWADQLRAQDAWATFEAGSTRRLEVRLGRLRKNLSVEWTDPS